MFCFTLNTFQHTVSYWIPFSTLLCSVFQTEYLSAHCYMFCVSHWIPFSTLFHVVCFTLNTFQHTVLCSVFHTEYLSALLFHVLCWRSHDSPKAALQTDTQYLWGLKFYVLCYLCFVFHIKNEKHKHAITQFSEYNNLSYNINSSSTSLCVHHS